jgi:hypothetical protein
MMYKPSSLLKIAIIACQGVVFSVLPASAQVIQLDGGSSSLYQAAGAGVKLYFPNSTLSFSGGVANGHIELGASDSFLFHDWTVTAGDSFQSFSATSSGVSVPLRGLAVTRHTPQTKLSVFAGGTGNAFQNPFFSAGSTTHFGAGLDYERRYRAGLTLSALAVAAPLRNTALAGLDWKGHSFKFSAGGGLLQNAPYVNASLAYQARHWVAEAAHSTYIFAGSSVSVDSVASAVMVSVFDFHGTYLIRRGETYGAGLRLGWFSLRADRFQMKANVQTFGTVQERIGRHFQISEYVGHSPSAGFEMQFNRFSAGVSYQILFYPFEQQSFQRTLSAHLSFRIRDAVVNLAGLIPPVGKPLYTVGGEDYFAGPYAGSQGMPQHAGSFGKYEIRGTVTDEDGKSVQGAAVMIGKAVVYSNQAGEFCIRTGKNGPQKITVPLDQWATPGEWVIINAPLTATPGTESKIVVGQK